MSRISAGSPRARPIHPWPLRVTHWLNAAAIVMMVGSGLEIYDASPLFSFTFPQFITIGHWLGGAVAWHLAAMWLLATNGLVYVFWGLASGHFRRKFLPLRPRDILHDSILALHLRLGHDKGEYNSVQRAMYVGVLVLGVGAVLSGLAIWKPVQLWFLTELFGGFVVARYFHFFAMSGIALFLVVHLLMVALVPKVLLPMVVGGTLETE
jgi:thiosulfate reductase cytochrome b subunit